MLRTSVMFFYVVKPCNFLVRIACALDLFLLNLTANLHGLFVIFWYFTYRSLLLTIGWARETRIDTASSIEGVAVAIGW